MSLCVNKVSYEDALELLESAVGEFHLGGLTIFKTSGDEGTSRIVVLNELEADTGAAVITL